jgi:GTPase SAR1 family protein
MNISENPSRQENTADKKKPVIAIMGEFSVGKSTLSNLLIGSNPLTVRVTATQLPPIWISHGDADPFREDLDGNIIPVDIDRLDEVPLAETAVIRIFMKSQILELCDLIDMPGISDPNMASSVWENMIHHADGVLWCTHATQAWRQSEAAVWKSLDSDLYDKSLLLITRIDKILTDVDRRKVLRRVARETEGLFADIFPISLTRAIAGKDQRGLWIESGGAAFIDRLVDLTMQLSNSGDQKIISQFAPPENVVAIEPTTMVRPSRVVPNHHSQRPARPARPLPRATEAFGGDAARVHETP